MNPKLKNKVFLDFETRSKISIEHGAFKYASHPSTEILITSYAIEDQPTQITTMDQVEFIRALWKAMEEGYIIVAHNMLFEIAIIWFQKNNWPKVKLSQFQCTMQMAGRAGLPLSLGDCAKALNITNKLDTGKGLIKLFCIPQKDGTFIEMDSRPKSKHDFMVYGGVDVDVCREIYLNLPEWKETELADVLFDLECNMRGVPVDVELSKRIYENILRQQEGFANKVTKLTNGVITKMTQAARIKNWMLANVNSQIPNCTADTVIEILDGKHGTVDNTSKQILEMRQHAGKSSTGKYVRFINSTVHDKIHGMIISFGAHTGRPVSKLLNLYNLPKPSIKYESMDILVEDMKSMDTKEVTEKYGSYLKAASTAIRGMITAPEGQVLCVSDYAAIEARIVFWLASCNKGLQMYKDGVDAYKMIASKIFNRPYNSIEDEQRWVGKQVILGAGYGLGGQGFVNSCARWGVDVELDLATESISAYRDTYPEVVHLWNSLENSALHALKTGKVVKAALDKIVFKSHRTKSGVIMLQMKLPSGRCINYPHARIDIVTTPWGAKKKALTYKKVTNGGYYRESTYGGKLAENAVQAVARDIMYYGAQCASHKYDILFSVYDEVISLVDEADANMDEYNMMLCTTPAWASDLPLEAEGKILKHYQKL